MNTMPEPVSIATSVFSGFNTLIKAISLAAHYKEVPREVTQLHTNIERAESSINTARRLVRTKAHFLDPRLIEETNKSIDATNSVLLLVRDSIEACRKDIQIEKTVSFKNRAAWLLWKNQEFLSQLQTLGNCLNGLDRDIVRMEMARPPIILVNSNAAPPAYVTPTQDGENSRGSKERTGLVLNEKPPFPRSPTKRLRSRSKNSSQVSLNKHVDALSPANEGGDEGYESDEAVPARSRSTPISVASNTQDTMDDVNLFATATIGIDTSSIGISIMQNDPLRHVQFLQFPQDAGNFAEPLEGTIIPELPATRGDEYESGAAAPVAPTCLSLSSRNPWRKFVAQSSASSRKSTDSINRGGTPIQSPNFGNSRVWNHTSSNSIEDVEEITKNPLHLSTTAPPAPYVTGTGDGLKCQETERRPAKWRRKSDFI